MSEPGEIILVTAVAGGVKYTPSWFICKGARGRGSCSVEIIPKPPFFKGSQVSIHIILEEELVPGGSHGNNSTLHFLL